MRTICYILYLVLMLNNIYRVEKTFSSTLYVFGRYLKAGTSKWKEFDEKYYINNIIKEMDNDRI